MSQRPLNLADVLEVMADSVPDRNAVVTMDHAYTYAELDERSTRFANHLISLGVQPGDHVAVHSDNRIEWVDAFYGCFKARAVPININYKYLREELAYLYDNSDAVVAVVAPAYAEALEAVRTDRLRHVIVLDEGYDAALAAASTERRVEGRAEDDLYIVYTGGTTGNPKGVMWRQADIVRSALNAARYGAPIESVEKLGEEAAANENPMVIMAAGPMMHGGSQWILGNAHVSGQTVAFYTEHSFDAAKVLDLAAKAGVVSLAMLGDAMARPIAEAVLAEPDRWDLSGLMALSNGAAPLSKAVRDELREAFPGKFILDTFGSSEAGASGSHMDTGEGGEVRFSMSDEMEVLDADMKPAAVGERGMFAKTGAIPLGYYKDEKKTAATFPEVDGRRWVMPGDFAQREEDGSITLLGRGSVCINTGGEKVHPEEVEAVLKRHPDVFDAVVVGTPSERWGQQVTALVHPRAGSSLTEEQVREHCHSLIANYKCPKQVFIVDEVPRTPVSKVDYPAATRRAIELTGR
ncbi:AMP-binding protein [Nocardioides piscis]|uniref:AMP-binding protein n=1 Tax=Nocardioides piscis TaxID=2714938 RepID=A0A6G7YBZ0_9ACTN|nr:AMP-binding protein [Nocardioides piscis]QIK74127.1 AMP-binding protein [Nocardioides piscis]